MLVATFIVKLIRIIQKNVPARLLLLVELQVFPVQ